MHGRNNWPFVPWLVLAAGAALSAEQPQQSQEVTVEALMPDYATSVNDAYLCTAVALPDEPLKLIEIRPQASQAVAHHMLLFGCTAPANRDKVWNCHMSSPCGGESDSVLYGWGKDAPAMHLPDGVGFSVGPRTAIRTVVLQVHYLNPRPEGDHTGVHLTLTSAPVPYSAGMITYASMFSLPAKTPSTKISNACCYSGNEALQPFAFRVHTHALGRRVWGFRTTATNEEEELVSQDPQLPQGFYPVADQDRKTLYPGDSVGATCDFDSSASDVTVRAGSTRKDEMCNLYMMVYSDSPYFISCVNNSPWGQGEGPGRLSSDAALVPESPMVWQPPAAMQGAADEDRIGQISGVVRGNNGTLWVFQRGSRIWNANSYDGGGNGDRITYTDAITTNALLNLDAETGRVIGGFGKDMFFMPHGLATDRQGHLWVTDTGLHQVMKLSPSGEKLLEIGERMVPGHDRTHFCKPTGVALSKNGDVFVADGYCNHRVVRLSADGAFKAEYRLKEGKLDIPHALVLDECNGALHVADREASRVQQFDIDSGDAERDYDVAAFGMPYALTRGPYGSLLALCWKPASGEVWVVLINTKSGEPIAGSWQVEGVEAPHDIALGAAPMRITGAGERLHAIYITETRAAGSSLRKFILVPEGMALPEGGTVTDQSSTNAAVLTKPNASREEHRKEQEVNGANGTGKLSQDLSQPPNVEYDDSVSNEAVARIFKFGLPAAALFGLVALLLWRRMEGFDFHAVPSQDSEENRP